MTCNNLVSFIYTWSLLPTKLLRLLYADLFTSYIIRALIPYHSYLLLLLNHVVIVVNLCCVESLWKIDVHLISTLVNKSRYYYYLLLSLLCIIIIIISLERYIWTVTSYLIRLQRWHQVSYPITAIRWISFHTILKLNCPLVFVWLFFWRYLTRLLFDIKVNIHKAMNSFKFNYETTLELVPGTNQY